MNRVIAQQENEIFIIDIDKKNEFNLKIGRILDVKRNTLYPENLIDSIFARGYWEAFKGDEVPILKTFEKLL